jgi:hypothetical protein
MQNNPIRMSDHEDFLTMSCREERKAELFGPSIASQVEAAILAAVRDYHDGEEVEGMDAELVY